MGKDDRHTKEKGIKIIDPEKITYTFTGKDDPFDIVCRQAISLLLYEKTKAYRG